MRKKIVAGNWKMNKTFSEGIDLINQIIPKSESIKNVQLIIAPAYILTNQASIMIMNKKIELAGQNCANHKEGAFTGEVSASMLQSAGATCVILGHSERRAFYHETDEIINEKIKLSLENNLTPIVCCGEVLKERENNQHFDVVAKQIKGMFQGISPHEFKHIVLAYEPVWAIGTGKTASPEQAQEMHLFIRNTIKALYGSELADQLSILYGGSCKPSNAKELFANADVDGGLIGGASLNADDFIAIANSFKKKHMDYIELSCEISAQNTQEIIDILIAELNEIGFESYTESENQLNAYILEKDFDLEKVKHLQANQIPDVDIRYSHQVIKKENWNAVWEKNFEPIFVDDLCHIRAPFHDSKPNMAFEIIIEPKMSFGTGHHETTYLMLKTILELDCKDKKVLDMGCGTGVLAILASFKGAKEVTAIDIDEWAYTNTLENIEKNNCSNIKVFQGDASLLSHQEFDLIIANINRNILLEDIKHYAQVLKTGGTLLLSGLYEADLPMIQAETSNQNIEYISHYDKNNWIAAKFLKK